MPTPELVKCPICGIERGKDWLASHVKADHVPLVANAVDCLECEEVYPGEIECPEDPEDHATTPAFITQEPLGLPNDMDFFHFGREQYEYTGEDMVKEARR